MKISKIYYFRHSFPFKFISFFLKGVYHLLWPISKISDRLLALRRSVYLHYFNHSFLVRNDDIFIVTYTRSGTTWLQMILYQLTSKGNMTFNHISEKIPFFDRLPNSKLDVFQMDSPRIFKTHLYYSKIPKYQCKYIYVTRNGLDVATSLYYHYKNLNVFKGDFKKFFNEIFMRKESWFQHVYEWHRNSKNLNVLYLTYEDLKADLSKEIKRIIQFCGFKINKKHFQRVLERSSFLYMKEHESKFEFITERMLERGEEFGQFIRCGKVGEYKSVVSTELEKRYFALYNKKLLGVINRTYFTSK